jgi:hypothetical protein
MAQDEYIKNLMSNFRPKVAFENASSSKGGNGTVHKTAFLQDDIIAVLEDIRDMKIEGDKKRLIKIDEKNEEILKVLYPVFSVDVTRFVNFLLTKFFEEHPEIVEEIKKSFKNL